MTFAYAQTPALPQSDGAPVGSAYILGKVTDQPTGFMLQGADVYLDLANDRLAATPNVLPVHRIVAPDGDHDGIVDAYDEDLESPSGNIVLVNGYDEQTYARLFETEFEFDGPDDDDEPFGVHNEIRVALAEEIFDDTLVVTIGIIYDDNQEVVIQIPYEEGETRYDQEFNSGGLDFELTLRWEEDEPYNIKVTAEPPEVEVGPSIILTGLTYYSEQEQRQYSDLLGISAFQDGEWGYYVYAKKWKTGILDSNGKFAQFLTEGASCQTSVVGCIAGTSCIFGTCSTMVPVGETLDSGFDYPADNAVQNGVSIPRAQATDLLSYYDDLQFDYRVTRQQVNEGDELGSYLEEQLTGTPVAFIADGVVCYETWRYRIRMTTLNLITGGSVSDSVRIMFGALDEPWTHSDTETDSEPVMDSYGAESDEEVCPEHWYWEFDNQRPKQDGFVFYHYDQTTCSDACKQKTGSPSCTQTNLYDQPCYVCPPVIDIEIG